MPTTFIATASLSTPGISFLTVTLNGADLPVARDPSGNLSGRRKLALPNSFQGHIDIRGIAPTDWTVSLEILTIPDAQSVFKQDIKGHIPQHLVDSWTGTITLSAPTPKAQTVNPAITGDK
jgi:hypothetical protein